MIDQGEADDKIIAVHYDDPEFSHYSSIDDLPPHRLMEIKRFFEDYKALEKKEVRVDGFFGIEKSLELIEEAVSFYKKRPISK